MRHPDLSELLAGRACCPRGVVRRLALVFLSVCPVIAYGQNEPTDNMATNSMVVLATEGSAEIKKADLAPARAHAGTTLEPGDSFSTGPEGRALISLNPGGAMRVRPKTDITIRPAKESGRRPIIEFFRSSLFFFNREKAIEVELKNGIASAASKGTEFEVSSTAEGSMVVTVIDGEVELSNAQGTVTVRNNQRGVAEPRRVPTVEDVPAARHAIDWVLHYPAVLHLGDFELGGDERAVLANTLAAYRDGDIAKACALYPPERHPTTPAETALRATLLLAVGEVGTARDLLASWPTETSLVEPVRRLMAAVTFAPFTPAGAPVTASDWLAESYSLQSRALTDHTALNQARVAANRAIERAPSFGLAWARVAELAFSFGDIQDAKNALKRALDLSPRSASALALQGFVLAAENRIPGAIASFEEAMTVDPSLASSWLGRGLCRIREGQLAKGEDDLLVAAALDPNRAIYRSYLGKSFAEQRALSKAGKELDLAKRIDPGDPTSWLYRALVHQARNEVNDAIANLERSKALNDNRSLYRSDQLLDQDRAVRSANLARIYQDAAMPEVAYREAVQAVNNDYANYSAHLFLANSYEDRRDPRLFGLRYETAANTEYLLANLLSPVGAGTLSRSISQQEYSKLFERDRLGVTSLTEYLSRGDWIQSGAQFGVFGGTSYAVEGYYRSENGEWANGDSETMQISVQLKQQITLNDSVYFHAGWLDRESGDVAPRYDPALASPTFRAHEQQEPLLGLGYHREWRPGMHTLVLFGILKDELDFGAATWPVPLALLETTTGEASLTPLPLSQSYQSRLEIFSIEAQQLWRQSDRHDSILGVRYQWGTLDPSYIHSAPQDWQDFFLTSRTGSVDGNVDRLAAYAYHRWEIIPHVWVQGGVAYDRLSFPAGFLYPPLEKQDQTEEQVSPKIGLLAQPFADTTVRAAFSRSLSGATLEQSYRLEPSQMAGFTQAYRGVIPESAAGGPIPGASHDIVGFSVEQRFKTRTYLGLTAEMLLSDTSRYAGAYQIDPIQDIEVSDALYSTGFDFSERSLEFTVNQLIASEWSVGVRYRVTRSELDSFPTGFALPVGDPGPYQEDVEATLHQLTLVGAFNHRSGLFARVEGSWYYQLNSGYDPALADENIWQLNAFAGFRFPKRQVEVSVGILNLTDQDYRLNPLNTDSWPPRDRTLAVRLRLNL